MLAWMRKHKRKLALLAVAAAGMRGRSWEGEVSGGVLLLHVQAATWAGVGC